MDRVTALPRSFSSPPLTALQRSAPLERAPRGGAPTTASPKKHKDVTRFTNAVLAGSDFDASAVMRRYWEGEYAPHRIRELFGALQGPALAQAVDQVRDALRAHLQAQRFGPNALDQEMKAFEALFGPLRVIANSEAQDSAAHAQEPLEPRAPEGLAQGGDAPGRAHRRPYPQVMAFQQARRVIHRLLDHPLRTEADFDSVWTLFGQRTGLERLRSLDAVEEALNDDALRDAIAEPDRQRISACIDAMRARVEVKEEDRLLAQLLGWRPPGAPRGSPQQPATSGAPDPWTVIGRMRKGKFADADAAAVVELFGGCTGAALEDALDETERALREDALQADPRVPAAELDELFACLRSYRDSLASEADDAMQCLIAQVDQMVASNGGVDGPAPLRTASQPDAVAVLDQLILQVQRGLTRRARMANLQTAVFRRALEQGGMPALMRLLATLEPVRQWSVLTTLLEDPALSDDHPELRGLEADIHRHYVASQRGDRPLEGVLRWHRRLLSAGRHTPPEPPAVPPGMAPERWIEALRIALFQAYPEPSRQRKQRLDALDRYRQALGVKTDREQAQALWLDSVEDALAASACGHSLLRRLRERLTSDANVALALLAALEDLPHFSPAQRTWIYRAAAILMATNGHSLHCIGVPYLQRTTPRQLSVFYPHKPKLGDPPQAWDRYQELVDAWMLHEPLVFSDLNKVREWVAAPPTTRPGPAGEVLTLTPGEQCDRLLCQSGLPPKRVELALLRLAQSCRDPDDRETSLLVQRLYSELIRSERNDAGRNLPMTAIEILERMLGVLLNAVREGGSHGLGLFAARLLTHALGAWAAVAMGVVACGVSLWAWHYLEHAKSPDYHLNPSTLLDFFVAFVPGMNTAALSVFLLCAGGLVERGVHVSLDIGAPLWEMDWARAIRQLIQSGTQRLYFGFRLTDQHGAGLSARFIFFLNCFRDASYVISSPLLLIRFADYLNDLMAHWGPPQTPAEVVLYIFMKCLPSMLNEALDGMNPDIVNLVARLFSWLGGVLGVREDDLRLQPNVRIQWNAIPRHLGDQTAGRLNIVGLQDPFHAASALSAYLDQPDLAAFFRGTAVVLNGFLGSLRGRELSYLRTTDPKDSALPPTDGFNPKNPDGLLMLLLHAAAAVQSKAHQAARDAGWLGGPAPTPPETPPSRQTRLLSRTAQLMSSRGGAPEATRRDDPEKDQDQPASEAGADDPGPLVELSDATPRWPRHPPDDFSEQ